MDLSELKNLDLDFQNVGNWPIALKTVATVLVCIAVLGAGYWFDTQDQLVTLEASEKKEATLKKTFESKQAKAVNLEAYKQQMVEMNSTFGTMLRQLPSQTEVAGLLVDISQTGLASGLEFELFQPSGERPAEFYAELPINIRVTGNYHRFGNFVSGVAALPRIVTLHNISITPSGNTFTMDALAKTYRYIDENEQTPSKKNKGKKGRRR
ncbi:MAG: type 4a pilus biogenesis protein PilO [Gammaproteobacteria bacterium]|nr:type 4a pilus biogenesis protein PilO [Gammaproteobacteria bacterium]